MRNANSRKPKRPAALAHLMDAPASPTAPAPLIAFVGRATELQLALARLERFGVVGISGPPGSGKSALAAQIVQRVAQPTLWIVLGANLGNPVEDLIWQLARPLLARQPGLAATLQVEALSPLVLIQILVNLYTQKTLLICIDIPEPIPAPEINVLLGSLADLIAQLPGRPIRLILAGRSLPTHVLPYTMAPLAGLTEAEIGAWAAQAGLQLDAQELTQIVEQTGGLPSTLLALFDLMSLRRPASFARLMGLHRLRLLVAGILGRLPIAEQRLLAELALMPERHQPPAYDLAPGLDHLEEHGLIRHSPNQIQLHPLVRSYFQQLYARPQSPAGPG